MTVLRLHQFGLLIRKLKSCIKPNLRIKITLQYINIKLYRLNWYQQTEDEPTGLKLILHFIKSLQKKGQV